MWNGERVALKISYKQKISYKDLTYHFKSIEIRLKNFNAFERPFCILRNVKDGNTTLGKTKTETEN